MPTPDEQLLGPAIEHATARVPVAAPGQAVGEVRSAISATTFETAAAVAVLDGRALAGLVSIEALLPAADDATVDSLMDTDPPVLTPGKDDEVAAREMCRRGEATMAVVDSSGGFRGLVPPERMLAVVLDEHDRDLARLGGFLAGTSRSRRAAEESVGRRLYHRIPWLLLGLVGAMASAVLVGSFEQELDRKVLLAFFVPAVIYMAGAIGTQTEAVLIRGLAAGIRVRDVAWGELVTSTALGLLVGAVFFPFALLGWGETDVAAAVALALFASCAVATVVAIALPWAFQRLGTDPAFGTGPLATVIQDLLGIAIYLAIAVPLAG